MTTVNLYIETDQGIDVYEDIYYVAVENGFVTVCFQDGSEHCENATLVRNFGTELVEDDEDEKVQAVREPSPYVFFESDGYQWRVNLQYLETEYRTPGREWRTRPHAPLEVLEKAAERGYIQRVDRLSDDPEA